jgi:myo-inositol 2-dehydrogenase/D-chiro-inositol 1-dehydrogenase
MVTVGDVRATDMTCYGADGIGIDTARRDTDLLRSAYLGELTAFADAARSASPVLVTGADARTALAIALAAIRSVETDATVAISDIDTPTGVTA